MSLIQEALSKTQNQTAPRGSAAPAKPQVEKKPASIVGLDSFDREVEQKINEIPQEARAAKSAERKSYLPIVALLILGSAIAIALIFWLRSQQPQTEAVPPLVVDIQKSTFVSKPQLAQPPVAVKDQFVTLAEVSDAKGKFELNGIAWGGDQPYALINGQIMRVGDKVERKVIVQRIEKEYVDLDYRGDLVRLELRR